MKHILVCLVLLAACAAPAFSQDGEIPPGLDGAVEFRFDPEMIKSVEEAKVIVKNNHDFTIKYAPPGAGNIDYKMIILSPAGDTDFPMIILGQEDDVEDYLLNDLHEEPDSFTSGLIYGKVLGRKFEDVLSGVRAAAASGDPEQLVAAKTRLEAMVDETLHKQGSTVKKPEFYLALENLDSLSDRELMAFVPMHLEKVHSYPNPFYPDRHERLKLASASVYGGEVISISVKVYDVRGSLVNKLESRLACNGINDYQSGIENNGFTLMTMDGFINSKGLPPASGIYLSEITAETLLYQATYKVKISVVK